MSEPKPPEPDETQEVPKVTVFDTAKLSQTEIETSEMERVESLTVDLDQFTEFQELMCNHRMTIRKLILKLKELFKVDQRLILAHIDNSRFSNRDFLDYYSEPLVDLDRPNEAEKEIFSFEQESDEPLSGGKIQNIFDFLQSHLSLNEADTRKFSRCFVLLSFTKVGGQVTLKQIYLFGMRTNLTIEQQIAFVDFMKRIGEEHPTNLIALSTIKLKKQF